MPLGMTCQAQEKVWACCMCTFTASLIVYVERCSGVCSHLQVMRQVIGEKLQLVSGEASEQS